MVDDDPTSLALLEATLGGLGVDLVAAATGEAAVAWAASQDFAVILLDFNLPGMDGIAAAAALRAQARSADTPLIFISGALGVARQQEAYAAGAVDVLAKPFNVHALRAKVAVFIELFRSRQAMRAAERSAAEAAHRPQQELWRTTLASIGDAVIATDMRRQVTFINAEAERLTGWTAAEAVGRDLDSVFRIVNETTRVKVSCPVEKVIVSGRVAGLANHTVLIGRRGCEWPIDDSAAPIRGEAGDILGVVLVFRDISEKHAAQRALHEANSSLERRVAERTAELDSERAFLAAVLEAIEDGVVACDPQGRLTLFNRATRDFHGLPPQPLPPEQWADHYDLYRADGKTRLPIEEIPLFLALSGQHIRDVRMVIAPKQGLPRTLLASGQPLRDAEGTLLGAVVSMHDVSASYEVIAMREAAALASEADRRKSEFLATLAHELRNPLAPLRTGLELMRLSADDPAAVGRVRDMMERQIGHMVRLVDDLLDIARISTGKVELRIERAELQTIVDSAIEISLPVVTASRHTLSVDVPPGLRPIEVDRIRMTQILSNLLNNAAKYTPAGGTIRLAVSEEPEAVVIAVSDSGIGIESRSLDDIFEIFSQIRPGHDRAQGGLGIGLSLVRRLVDLHGGTVLATSAGIGHGATLTVRLPRRCAGFVDGAPSAASHAANGAAGSGFKVLVVDDNIDAAEMLSMVLGRGGQITRVAHDGAQALAIAQGFRPDIVFLDIGLPGRNGYEVARDLRSMPGMADAVLVALTGWGAREDRERARDAGFHHHLTKPADHAAVHALIAACTASRRR